MAKKLTKKEKEKILATTQKMQTWSTEAENYRSSYDWKWFIYDLFVNGYHYAKWDRQTQQISTSVKDKGRPKIVINMVYVTLRAVRNFVLRNRPRAEVTPNDLTPENIDEVINLNRYLDYLHERLKLRKKLKETVWHALKYSVGFWQVLWDEDVKEISVSVVDPYDLYIDPVARSLDEARYVILKVRRNIVDVINDPKYRDFIKKNDIEIKPDGKIAASQMKERMMSLEGYSSINNSQSGKKTVLVEEFWYVDYDDEGNKKWMITTMAGGHVIRPPEETGLNRLPFFKLSADVEPLKMYGQGWVKNLIPVNKLLNRLESSVAEYNELINKGKWVSDKGAGVRVINNQHGQIIQKKRGFEVQQVPITPLNISVFRQIENANRYIEDMGGKHDASLGRMPTGAKSGKALEALQVGDSNNMSEVVENVEEFLEEVFEYILEIAAEKYQFARRIIPISKTGERDFITVIGEDAPAIPEGSTVIRKKNTVDVKITSWLAETAEARRDALKELYQLQAIDQETLLKGYELGNVAEIIRQSQIEKEMDRRLQTRQQVALANAQNQKNQKEEPQQAGAVQANAALQAILTGQEPEVPQDVSMEYLDYIEEFMQTPEFQQLPREQQQMIIQHAQQAQMTVR
ncbi:MAG: hypothetical protein D6822_07010 [Cyanobacteria bacterium J149]|nr:MAG: hypothetical protein D6822_07010 [Cyanobacteria bacterium J149]